MKIFILAFGKLKTPGLREAADHYLKMIQPWASLEELELKPAALSQKTAEAMRVVQGKEFEILSERLKGTLGSRGKYFLMDESGPALNTHAWARQLQGWESAGPAQAAFCIGSSAGFSEQAKKEAAGLFSLGPQTLSHELARVVLLEQLYRAFSVVRGHPYHHET